MASRTLVIQCGCDDTDCHEGLIVPRRLARQLQGRPILAIVSSACHRSGRIRNVDRVEFREAGFVVIRLRRPYFKPGEDFAKPVVWTRGVGADPLSFGARPVYKNGHPDFSILTKRSFAF